MVCIPVRPVPRIPRSERDPSDVPPPGVGIVEEIDECGAPSVVAIAPGGIQSTVTGLNVKAGYPRPAKPLYQRPSAIVITSQAPGLAWAPGPANARHPEPH